MSARKLEQGDALIIVDLQVDFCPGGALAVPGGDAVVPVLNRWIDRAREVGALVVASRDWHPADHCSFLAQGGPWPPHCVRDTDGAAFHPDLRLPDDARIISKGVHSDHDDLSAFGPPGLAAPMWGHGVQRLFVGGLAQEVCVESTVLDGLRAGFEVHVIVDATAALERTPGDGEKALGEMEAAGAILEWEQARA